MFWAPASGEVRNINHTSQLPISALSSVPSQQLSQLACGVCGWRRVAGSQQGVANRSLMRPEGQGCVGRAGSVGITVKVGLKALCDFYSFST